MGRSILRGLLWTVGIVVALFGAALIVSSLSGRQAPIDIVAAGKAKLGIDLESERVPTNGIHLHVVMAGPKDGPPVVLLHGYPEFWWGWSRQIAQLSRAGFRVIVPDQRGYDRSDKPVGVEAYRIENLELDIIGLITQLGYDKVNLAGHDWGGVVAWRLAIDYPDRFRKLVIFNMGHPLAFRDAEATAPQQKTISWYRTFFQLPVIPEAVGRFNNWSLLEKSLRNTSRPGTFPDDEMVYYKAAWDHDGAMHSMVNWYRAGFRFMRDPTGDGMVRVPTRIVWGMKEAFMESRVARLSVPHCAEASVVEVPDAGHWLLHEEPELTSRQMIEFFSAQ